MVAWHLLFALSGQRYAAPDAALQLAPRLPPPYQLPILVPGTAARLACDAHTCRLTVVAGVPLRLATLSVHGVQPRVGVLPRTLARGDVIAWSMSSRR